jgi:diguanylate cyclase (GGDEF)-like protein
MSVQAAWARFALAIAFVGLGVFGMVLLVTPPESEVNQFFSLWWYQGLVLAAVLIAAVRAATVARDRLAWSVIAFSLSCSAFAEIYYAIVKPVAYPSLADVAWIAFYPAAYVGMVLLLRRRARSITGTLWLDGITASVAAAALGAAVIVEVVLETTEGSLGVVATNLAYPLGDVLLLSVVFGVFSLARWRPGSVWLVLGLGMLATAIADAIYLFQTAQGTYVQGNVVDVLWPASMLLIAGAAWVPERDARGLEVAGRPLLAVPAICALVATGILVYDHFSRVNALALALATGTILLVTLRLAATFRENRRLFELTRHEAVTDALTGLANRRQLVADLESRLDEEHPASTLLMIFDLDGFKSYNDSFGHPAGDALLARLGSKLASVPGPLGSVYRLGGDEFCLIAPVAPGEAEALIDRACAALTEYGEGFEVSSSFGAIMIPDEATDASEALRLADERLYAQKYSRRTETDRTLHALLDALSEREPGIQVHAEGVAALAVQVSGMLGFRRDEVDELSRAAQLHDIGKLAVPDEILHKPGALDEREWEFIQQHTLVGERILRASPAFRSVATVVRSTHERWDGAGYPDNLVGDDIPLGARIIAACDAYVALISPRPYRPARSPEDALEELERCAGSQFDPTVVRVLTAVVRDGLEAEQAA